MGSMTYDRGTNLLDFVSAGKTNVESLRYYFKPKQAESKTTIEGWDNVEGSVSGKNLLDPSLYKTRSQQDIVYIGLNNSYNKADGSFILPKGTYTFSRKVNGSDKWIEGRVYDINGVITYTYSSKNYLTFTLEQDQPVGFYASVNLNTSGSAINSKLMLEHNNTYSDYEPFCGQTLSIDFPSSTYGGYVDPAAGLLVTTYNTIDLGSLSWVKNTTAQFYASLPSDASATNGWLTPHYCEVYEDTEKTAYNKTKDQTISLSTTRIWVQDSTCDTAAELKTKLNGAIFVYESVKEIQSSITPTPITTCLRENYMWSNTNDKTTCTCVVNDSATVMRTKRRFAANEPHLEIASGNIASFSTDLKAPLKSCKVEFLPVQEGSGDPAPDNIRPITGWAGLEVTKCGKNLFDIDTIGYINSRYINWETGNAVTWGSSWNITNYIPIIPNLDYTIFCICNGLSPAGCAFYDDNQIYISGNQMNSTTNRFYIHTPNNSKYLRFSFVYNSNYHTLFPSLEFGTISESTYESYTGTTIPLSWENEGGTVYGGWVDLVSGNVYQEWEYGSAVWGDIRGGQNATTGFYRGDINLNHPIQSEHSTTTTSQLLRCNILNRCVWKMQDVAWAHMFSGNSSINNDNGVVYVFFDDAVDISTTIEVCAKLSNPILVTTLSPTQLKTLLGSNNIYSTSNSTTTAQYWVH